MKNPTQMRQIAIEKTPVERRLMQRLRYAPLGECLTFEQFLELAKQGRRAAGYYEQMAHIISCPACRRTYLELRVILQAQRPSLARWLSRLTTPRLPQWALATGFAGVVFAFAVWALYPKPSDSKTLIATNSTTTTDNSGARNPTPTTPQNAQVAQRPPSGSAPTKESEPASPVVTSRKTSEPSDKKENAPIVVARRQDPTPSERKPNQASHLPTTPSDTPRRTQVAKSEPRKPTESPPEPAQNQASPIERELQVAGRFLSRGAEALQRTLASLAGGSVRSGGDDTRGSQQIRILQPDLSETNLLEDTTLTLRWSPVDHAVRYRLTLRHSDTGETLLEEELPATQTQFQLRSLASGNEYELILSASRGERSTLRITLQFRVMSNAQRAELQWARQNATQAPLVAGLIFYQLERYPEALDALQRAQQKYPNDEEIKRALNNLRARARQ